MKKDFLISPQSSNNHIHGNSKLNNGILQINKSNILNGNNKAHHNANPLNGNFNKNALNGIYFYEVFYYYDYYGKIYIY